MNKHRKVAANKNILTSVAKLHLFFGLIYVAQIIVFDASKLITPEAVLKRWIAVSLLAATAVIVYYLSRIKPVNTNIALGVWALVLADIAFATFNVYTQRGMASRAVLLFMIPIIVVGVLKSKTALFTTAILSMTAYTLSAVAYFVNYFNEGYKVELYGEILFYSVVFLFAASLVWLVSKPAVKS